MADSLALSSTVDSSQERNGVRALNSSSRFGRAMRNLFLLPVDGLTVGDLLEIQHLHARMSEPHPGNVLEAYADQAERILRSANPVNWDPSTTAEGSANI